MRPFLRGMTADPVDEVRLDPDAVVRDGRVHRGHLDRRHRDALPDRLVPDRRVAPLVDREHEPGALSRVVDPGGRAEPEPLHPVRQPLWAELLRERDGADVRRELEDLRDRVVHRPARLGVVHRALPARAELEPVRQSESRLRGDEPVGERTRDRDQLEGRAGLVGVRQRAVPQQAGRPFGHARGVVRVVAGCLGHGENLAGRRVEDDRRRVLRVPRRDGLAEHLLGLRLDRVIDRGEHVRPLPHRARADHVDRTARRVADDGLLPRAAGELPVVLELEPAEAVVVDPRVAEHLGRDRPLRVGAQLFGVGEHALEALLQEELGRGRVGEALDVDEAALPVDDLRVEELPSTPRISWAASTIARAFLTCCGSA